MNTNDLFLHLIHFHAMTPLDEVINSFTHNNDQYLYIFAKVPTFSRNVKAMKIQKMISKS